MYPGLAARWYNACVMLCKIVYHRGNSITTNRHTVDDVCTATKFDVSIALTIRSSGCPMDRDSSISQVK